MRLREGKGGLLVEIIVCALIIAIVGVGVLGMLSIDRQFSVRSRKKIEALNLVRQKIEEFESVSYETIEAAANDSDSVTFSDGSTATRSWTFTDVDWDTDLNTDGREITVTVDW